MVHIAILLEVEIGTLDISLEPHASFTFFLLTSYSIVSLRGT